MRYRSIPILILICLFAVGCGDKIRLNGKVTFSDDNSPVPAGMVCFETDTFFARGDLEPDGTYAVSSMGNKDGLPAGVYRVYITGAEHSTENDSEGIAIMKPLIDKRFTDISTSGLAFEVTPSKRTFNFQVDRFQKH